MARSGDPETSFGEITRSLGLGKPEKRRRAEMTLSIDTEPAVGAAALGEVHSLRFRDARGEGVERVFVAEDLDADDDRP